MTGHVFHLPVPRAPADWMSQIVTTVDGLCSFEDLAVGDFVVRLDNEVARVDEVQPVSSREVFAVTLSDRSVILSTDDEYWQVRAPRSGWREVPFSQIRAEGLFACNGTGAAGRPQRRARHEVPTNKAPLDFTTSPWLPIHPYLLGYMLGNGHMSATPTISCDVGEERLWESLLPDGVSARNNPKYPFTWTLRRDPTGRGHGRENPLSRHLRSLALWDTRARSKFIPAGYLVSSISDRRHLLAGLLDSDGSARSGGSVYGSMSPHLAAGVAYLARSLGGVANIRQDANSFYVVDCQFEGEVPPFGLARKRKAFSPRRRQLRRTIRSVSPLGHHPSVAVTVGGRVMRTTDWIRL